MKIILRFFFFVIVSWLFIQSIPVQDYLLTKEWSQQLFLAFENTSPYFLQYWFLALMGLSAILLVVILIQYRTYRLRDQADKMRVQVIQRTQIIELQKKELERANEFKDKLFLLIAHDLQTPVEGLGNMSSRLNFLIEQERYEDLRKLGVVISTSSRNISKLISNLLNWTLIQKNQFYNNPKSLVLLTAISETLELYQTILKHKEIKFSKSLSPQLRVFVDEQILKTILRNIIDNAVKYTPQQGYIHLQCAAQEDSVELVLENNGPSIPQETIQTLDEDYLVKDKALPGIGLRLCKKMTALCEGEFTVESMTPYQTQVRIKLPRVSSVSTSKIENLELTFDLN